LVEDIVLYQGMILDGRNRYRACLAAGVPPTTHDADKWIADPAAFVISVNIRRRHLNTEQKRELIIKIIAAAPEKSDRQIAKSIGVDHKTIGTARAKGEQLGSIPQLKKTMGADGKARKRPQSRTERRQVRLDRAMGRHIKAARENLELGDKYAEEARREYAAAAALGVPEDEGDSPEVIWRRGLLHRATNAAGEALYEDWSQFTVDPELIAAAELAAEAWGKTAAYLRELRHAPLRSDTADKTTDADEPTAASEAVADVFEEWADDLAARIAVARMTV
jgi:hypothetical protein